MVKNSDMGSKKVVEKKELGRPLKGQTSQLEAPLDPIPLTTVRAQSEPTSDTSVVQADQPSTERVRTPKLASFNQVIDLVSVFLAFEIKKEAD